jgi:hypothetical protein
MAIRHRTYWPEHGPLLWISCLEATVKTTIIAWRMRQVYFVEWQITRAAIINI